ELTTSETKVLHAASGGEWAYGEFAELAATMPVPDPASLTLKTENQFTLLGRRFTGVDTTAYVTCKPLFGADTLRDDMIYATFTKGPQIGATPGSFNEAHIKSMPGIIDAFIIDAFGDAKAFPTGTGAMFGGVAIVGTSTWAAIKAKRELEIQWDDTNAETATWDDLVARAYGMTDRDGDMELFAKGDAPAALGSAAQVVSAVYEYPYLSHAQLEPQTTTALYSNGTVEIWAPSQIPQGGETGAALRIDLPAEASTLH